jgi:hypothetical protein
MCTTDKLKNNYMFYLAGSEKDTNVNIQPALTDQDYEHPKGTAA